MNARVSDSTVIRHRQEIIRYCFSNEPLISIFPNSVGTFSRSSPHDETLPLTSLAASLYISLYLEGI